MKKQSAIRSSQSAILIVGAGPAGASLAIRLAQRNFAVTLIEREKFPRHKLCGEFISPECLSHFKDLDVLDEMLAVGGDRISETVFYSQTGKSIAVPSDWFQGDRNGALSISRAEMDFRLLEKAKSLGVEVLEETQVVGLIAEKNKILGVNARIANRETKEIFAGLIIDATGRANVLGKLAGKSKTQNSKSKTQNSKLVGFKTHLENVNLKKGVCEIYFFRGGYGGLSFVEQNRANHCFLLKAELVKEFNGNADEIVSNLVYKNQRAFEAMKNSVPVFDWLAVSVDGFGVKSLIPADNLISVGDAAAFIDPFTGSGMLMALESAEILARSICQNDFSFDAISRNYSILHGKKFRRRLVLCNFMRRAAFAPKLADRLIYLLSFSRRTTELITRSTRPQNS